MSLSRTRRVRAFTSATVMTVISPPVHMTVTATKAVHTSFSSHLEVATAAQARKANKRAAAKEAKRAEAEADVMEDIVAPAKSESSTKASAKSSESRDKVSA